MIKKQIKIFVLTLTLLVALFAGNVVNAAPATLPFIWGFENPAQIPKVTVSDLELNFSGLMANPASKVQSEVVKNGKYALKMEAKDVTWGMFMLPQLKKNTVYEVSFWAKADKFVNGVNLTLFARYQKPVEMFLGEKIRIDDGTYDWKQYKLEFEALKDGEVDLSISSFGVEANSGVLYIDSIILKEKGTADPKETLFNDATTTTAKVPTATDSNTPDTTATTLTEDTSKSDDSTTTSASTTAVNGKDTTTTTTSAKKKSNTAIIVGVIVAIVLVGGGAAAWFFLRKKPTDIQE